jgi:hypothetical protein
MFLGSRRKLSKCSSNSFHNSINISESMDKEKIYEIIEEILE